MRPPTTDPGRKALGLLSHYLSLGVTHAQGLPLGPENLGEFAAIFDGIVEEAVTRARVLSDADTPAGPDEVARWLLGDPAAVYPSLAELEAAGYVVITREVATRAAGALEEVGYLPGEETVEAFRVALDPSARVGTWEAIGGAGITTADAARAADALPGWADPSVDVAAEVRQAVADAYAKGDPDAG